MGKIVLEEEISIRITEKEKDFFIKEVDKKIDNFKNKLFSEIVRLDKRLNNIEKKSQTIHQELNFYVADSKAILFCEKLYFLWKNEHDIEWIDDMAHITQICINDKFGSRARVIRTIISFIDEIYVANHKLRSQFLHDLAIILGFNASDPKALATFRSAYNHESLKNDKMRNA